MFSKETYIARRRELLSKMKEEGGIIVFIGNVDAPAQYSNNAYKWRQDSTWLYFFGIDEPRYAAVLDIDSSEQTIFADDCDLDDIIWNGPTPSVAEIAEGTGISLTRCYRDLEVAVGMAQCAGRKVHFVPPTRYYNKIRLSQLALWEPSEALTKAVISMRLVKSEEEIAAIDNACDLGYEMHTAARNGIRLGRVEQEIVGDMEGIALAQGWGVSFPTILTQHGEVFHCHSHACEIAPGKLCVVDAGVESNAHYASDFTRTYPTSGKFTQKQKDIYEIVRLCNEHAFSMIAPGVAYRDVHLSVAGKMLEGLSALGLVGGDIDTMASEGIAGLFMPHGLGHNMGLDVHDMEDLGEDLVGYDPDQTRSAQLGLGSLRMARRLVPGNVITDEPGIYFIPALIEQWKKDGKGKGFVNFAKLEEYYDFGGIRLEDDVLVTPDGARRLGSRRLPIVPEEIEGLMGA